MRRVVAVAPLFFLLALLLSCGGDDRPALTPELFPGETWALEYTKSGGITGINQSLRVHSNGHVAVEDRRTNIRRESNLTASDLEYIRKLVVAANVPSLRSDSGAAMPDAVIVSLKVTSSTASYRTTLLNLPFSGDLMFLIQNLERLLYEGVRP